MRLISSVTKVNGSNFKLLAEEIKGDNPDATVIVFQNKKHWEADKESVAIVYEGDVYNFVSNQYAAQDVTVIKV